MHKTKIKIFLIISLFLIQTSSTNPTLNKEVITNTLSNNISVSLSDIHALETNIILLNYANDQNFTQGILSKLPSSIVINKEIPSITYTMKYNFIFPDNNFTNYFNSFIANNSMPNSPTVDINQTALEYQAQHNTVQNIFLNKTGTAINGSNVEDWLWQNGKQFRTENISYQIFLLNLTFISDKLYWFNISEPDEVTHQQRQEWRLEWDYPPTSTVNNFNVKFPYPGYSSRYPMYFLDPYAFNWYLNWTRIWRNVPTGENYYQYSNSLTGYLEKIGGFVNNRLLAGSFIGSWLNEIVSNLFVINPLYTITPPSSLKLQIAVITDESQSNPYPDLHWAINKSIITNQLQDILPNENISIETNYFNLSNHLGMQLLLDQNKMSIVPEPIPNYTYYNGYNISNFIPQFDNEFFGNTAYNLRAYVFILDNASFAGAKWNGGGLFTGLGGGGRLLILNEVDRLFYNRTTNPTPKESLSKVIIHEAGHAIGLPHPFVESTDKYSSDFIGDVMGYYPSTANFSYLMINNYQRLSLEPRINLIMNNLAQLLQTNLSLSYRQDLLTNYNLLVKNYRRLDIQSTKTDLDQLENLLKQKISLEPGNPKPPIFITTLKDRALILGSNETLNWNIYDLNPSNYQLFINNNLIKSGFWNNSYILSYTFQAKQLGVFNINLLIFDKFNLSASQTTIITVVNSLPTSKSSSTSFNSSNNMNIDIISSIILPMCIFLLYVLKIRGRNKL